MNSGSVPSVHKGYINTLGEKHINLSEVSGMKENLQEQNRGQQNEWVRRLFSDISEEQAESLVVIQGRNGQTTLIEVESESDRANLADRFLTEETAIEKSLKNNKVIAYV